MDVASSHAQDIGDHSILGHFGSDEAGLEERVARVCKISGSVAENIDYGNSSAQDIVCNMIIDDGMYARGQRINIMKKDHKYVGAALASHTELEFCCVIVFAEAVEDIEDSDMTLNLEEVKDLKVAGDSSSYQSEQCFRDQSEFYEEDNAVKTTFDDEISQVSVFKATVEKTQLEFIDEEVTLEVSSTHIEDESEKILPKTKPPLVPRAKVKNDDFLVSNFDRSELSKDAMNEIKELFDLYDTSGSGFLDSHALKAMKEQLSECSNSEVIQVMCNLEAEGNKLKYDDIVELISEKVSVSMSKQKSLSVQSPFAKKAFDANLYIRPEFNTSDILEIKAAFDMFDVDGNGTINPLDLKKALKTQRFDKSNSIVIRLINSIEVDSEEKINFGEFIDLLASEGNDSNSETEIRKLFNIFDVDGTGYIELANLKNIAREIGDTLDEQDIIMLFSQSDRDGDGRVSYLDFYNTMKKIKF